MTFRFRPLGPLPSLVEVVAGLWLLGQVLWADERYAPWFVVVAAALGAVVALVGIVGLLVAVRARSTTDEPEPGARSGDVTTARLD